MKTRLNPSGVYLRALQLLVILSLAILGHMLSPSTALAVGGIDHGGNGVFVESPQSPRLLFWDLFANAPQVSDQEPGDLIRLQTPSQSDAARGEIIDYRDFQSFAFLQERLHLWQARAKNLVGLISADDFVSSRGKAKYQLILLATPYSIVAVDQLAVPSSLPLSGVRAFAGAYFQESSGHIFINVPLWNRAGLLSQAALLLHERMRSLQLRFQLPNEELQRLVAMIILRDPGSVSQDEYDDDRFSKSWILLHGPRDEAGSLSKGIVGAAVGAAFHGAMLDCIQDRDSRTCAQKVVHDWTGKDVTFVDAQSYLKADLVASQALEQKILSLAPAQAIPLVSTGSRNAPVSVVPQTAPFAKMFGHYRIVGCLDKSRITSAVPLCEYSELEVAPNRQKPELIMISAFQKNTRGSLGFAFIGFHEGTTSSDLRKYEETGAKFASDKYSWSTKTDTVMTEHTLEKVSDEEYRFTWKYLIRADWKPSLNRDQEFELRLVKE